MILLFQSSFRLSEKNEKDKKRNALTPVSATPFRDGFATLNPPLGHAKARYKKSIFMYLYGGSKPYPVSATPTAFASQIGQFPPYAQSPSIANRQNKNVTVCTFLAAPQRG